MKDAKHPPPLRNFVGRWLWAWQCSPAENYVVLLQGLIFFLPFDSVSTINLKNPRSLVPDGMPVFPVWEVLGLILELWCKTFVQNVSNEERA